MKTKTIGYCLAWMMIGSALLVAAPVASAHYCVGDGHEACDGHYCPDDGRYHDHYSRHWWKDHRCRSGPCRGGTNVSAPTQYSVTPEFVEEILAGEAVPDATLPQIPGVGDTPTFGFALNCVAAA